MVLTDPDGLKEEVIGGKILIPPLWGQVSESYNLICLRLQCSDG